MRSLILRKRETTASFGFYYGIPRTTYESFEPSDATEVIESEEQSGDNQIPLAKRVYYDNFERIGRDVEKWAEEIMRDDDTKKDRNILGAEDQDSWTEIFCAKTFRQKFNMGDRKSTIQTPRQWVKWMRDSRGRDADPDDKQKHPCMKLIATIDAPFPIVCRYLSEKNRFREYNSLLIDQEDVEVLTPHSKICWSQSKKLLFIQPRDFVTYCRHRWLKDGTQLITNQACDHPNATLNITGSNGQNSIRNLSGYRAFSLRGATYVSRCPDFPSKRTKIVMLSHCNCGRDVPEWAVRAAVGVLAPIKPFEIIHRIDVGIRKARNELEMAEEKQNANSVMTTDTSRSCRPAGMAQMGYACFWPNGGGLVDVNDTINE
ncbi:unnamed protein product [Pseudo-nitzschia multistriata]|uniref:START domain-containing protein n=1 Tax=Pseudo-nitzschia multistriata TaxID=183589 RepID=A0A448ZKN5_9STRA|nr:unnamed protein product [Pseudo-nitzschia multistriata]